MRKYTLDTDIHLPHVAGETTPLPSAALAAIDPDRRHRRIDASFAGTAPSERE